jgi:long-chain acyl-CoA synthetase
LRILAAAQSLSTPLLPGDCSRLKRDCPNLSHAIVFDGSAEELRGCISFAELLEQSRRFHISQLDPLLEAVHPSDLATIMYTSGSTGEPKGVMRTHDNLLSNIASGGEIVLSKAEELTIIVLSLNHLFGRYGFLKSAVTGRTTAMIEAPELNLDLSVIQALRPTAISVVPRVMERLWNAILDLGRNREIWNRMEKLDRDNRLTDSGGCDAGDEIEALKTNLRPAVLQALGGRIKYITYGGAAMPPCILRFFDVIGVPLIGSYGSTECGGVTLCGIDNAKPGSLGKPFPNVALRLSEDGELLVRGPTVTPGYFEDPQATREAFDADGWFRTAIWAESTMRDLSISLGGRRIFLIVLTAPISIRPISKRCWKMTHSFGRRFYWAIIDHLSLLWWCRSGAV